MKKISSELSPFFCDYFDIQIAHHLHIDVKYILVSLSFV